MISFICVQAGFELTMLVVICTEYTGSCKKQKYELAV